MRTFTKTILASSFVLVSCTVVEFVNADSFSIGGNLSSYESNSSYTLRPMNQAEIQALSGMNRDSELDYEFHQKYGLNDGVPVDRDAPTHKIVELATEYNVPYPTPAEYQAQLAREQADTARLDRLNSQNSIRTQTYEEPQPYYYPAPVQYYNDYGNQGYHHSHHYYYNDHDADDGYYQRPPTHYQQPQSYYQSYSSTGFGINIGLGHGIDSSFGSHHSGFKR